MATAAQWIEGARPRTLPAAVAPVLAGTGVAAWTHERSASSEAVRSHDLWTAWAHLERAHILSQPMAVRHVRTHLAMLSSTS